MDAFKSGLDRNRDFSVSDIYRRPEGSGVQGALKGHGEVMA